MHSSTYTVSFDAYEDDWDAYEDDFDGFTVEDYYVDPETDRAERDHAGVCDLYAELTCENPY